MRVGTLWIGQRLGFLELLCLKSFADQGQIPLLYSYTDLDNVPDFVEHRDAREILPGERMLRDPVWGSPAAHADLFRLHLVRNTDTIWIDADSCALRRLESRNGYLLAGLCPNRRRILNGVVRLPKDSPALNAMLDFTTRKDCTPPWWDRKRRRAFARIYGAPPTLSALPLGTLGPEMYYHFLSAHDEPGGLLDHAELYALPFSSRRCWFDCPIETLDEHDWQDRMSIHFYASSFRKRLSRNSAPVHPQSLIAVLAHRHGVELPEGLRPEGR